MEFEVENGGGFVECDVSSRWNDPGVLSAFSARICDLGHTFRALSPPFLKDSPITSGHCYASGVTAALRDASYYLPVQPYPLQVQQPLPVLVVFVESANFITNTN